MESMLSGCFEKSANRNSAARLVFSDIRSFQFFDGIGGCAVLLACGLRIVKMTQIGTDNNARFRATPKRRHHSLDVFGRGVANGEWYECEMLKDGLEERQVNFQRVFARVSFVR